MASKRKKDKRKGRKAKKPKMAETADRHQLYQMSVQRPEVDIEFFIERFKEERGRKPYSFREDFCGTALMAIDWLRGNKKRSAIGVDLDGPTLDWGREHNLAKQKPHVKERLQLIQANVLDVTEPRVDIGCALNFSYCVFKERATLIAYFKTTLAGLEDDGMFFCELYGGTEGVDVLEESREVEGPGYDFDYIWDQADYNPIKNETLCHIHFDLPDGSRMEKAFTYDWRLWTIPEVKECLLEAGFKRVDVYWEGCDDDGEGEGNFRKTEREENQEGWLVYFVAVK